MLTITSCQVVQDTITERSPEEPYDWTRRIWCVIADTNDATHLHHRHFNTEAAAQKLADAVTARGTINLDHWFRQYNNDLPDYVLHPERPEYN